MRHLHGRPMGSGETATIKDAIKVRAARRHGKEVSAGASVVSLPQDSKGRAGRLRREQLGSGRLARIKD
jgi:hypothetical protein